MYVEEVSVTPCLILLLRCSLFISVMDRTLIWPSKSILHWGREGKKKEKMRDAKIAPVVLKAMGRKLNLIF